MSRANAPKNKVVPRSRTIVPRNRTVVPERVTSPSKEVYSESGTIGVLKYRYCHTPGSIILHLNFGRYVKGKRARDVETRTIYDAISEGHKDYSDIWLDVQHNRAIGCEIHVQRMEDEKV